jgi:hypothetical protein
VIATRPVAAFESNSINSKNPNNSDGDERYGAFGKVKLRIEHWLKHKESLGNKEN